MELGKSETEWGIPRTEGVQNGVSLDFYEGERQAKNVKKEGERGEETSGGGEK